MYHNLATSCKHLINFGPETPEFKRVKGVHPSSISSLYAFTLLLDLTGISTEFSRAITTQFCFIYMLKGVTAMPRRLHARLCHEFLVVYSLITKPANNNACRAAHTDNYR